MSSPCIANPNTANQEEDGVVVGVDLGKTVFQLCIANGAWRIVDTQRL